MSESEREAVIQAACSDEYRHMNPWEIVAVLAERQIYLASERTFYRILRKKDLLHHRGNTKAPSRHGKPKELIATGEDQVWSWDITWMRSNVVGLFFYAYIFIDIFTRDIVGWEVSDIESDEVSSAMIRRMSREHNLEYLNLHSDRGNPMKGATMLMTMYSLGVIPSLSRPRVSDDNPYSEALFRTVKYHRSYPGHFNCIEDAREWLAGFVHWYNTEHLHSGIGYVTPASRRDGSAQGVIDRRNETYMRAFLSHPERWANKPKLWATPNVVRLNPEKTKAVSLVQKGNDTLESGGCLDTNQSKISCLRAS